MRYVHMDGLRGVAAIGVLFSHAFQNFFPAMHFPGAGDTVPLILGSSPLSAFYGGEFSVFIFFVLSGFVLSASVSHSRLSLPTTIVRRYLRLTLPIMGITLIFLIAGRLGLFFNDRVAGIAPNMAALYPANYRPGVAEWLWKGLFGIYMIGDYLLDGVVWTMKVEIWGSLFVYMVWRLLPYSWMRIVISMMAFVLVEALLDKHSSLQGFQLFPLGLLIYEFSQQERWRRFADWPLKVGIPVILLGILFGATRVKHPVLPSIDPVLDFVAHPFFGNIAKDSEHQLGAVFLVAGLAFTKRLYKPLSTRLASYLGAISFPLYLVHQLILVSLGCYLFAWSYEVFGIGWTRAITIPAVVVAALAAAALLTRLVEMPSIAVAKRAGDSMEKWLRARRLVGRGIDPALKPSDA
jgi:peptidoglycan/LPS O-acetylase OafA/YrhL